MPTPNKYVRSTEESNTQIFKGRLSNHYYGSGPLSNIIIGLDSSYSIYAAIPYGCVIPALTEVIYILSGTKAYIISPSPQFTEGTLKTSLDVGGTAGIDVYVPTPLVAQAYLSGIYSLPTYNVKFPNGGIETITKEPDGGTNVENLKETNQLIAAAARQGYVVSASGRLYGNGVTMSYSRSQDNVQGSNLSLTSETVFSGSPEIINSKGYDIVFQDLKIQNLYGNKVYGSGSMVLCGYCNGSWRVVEASCTSIYEGAVV